ncbi:MAG: MaoC/PaaZ C-terminal domain-containing protein [Anaerolineae bacterium]
MTQGTEQRMWFEDFATGQEWTTSGRTVTEADIVAFAGLSGDFNPLHVDAEYARGTPFGERIAHGLLGLAMATGLASRASFMEGSVEAFLSLEWKFRAPVRIGDTIHAVLRVAGTRPMGDSGGLVMLDVSVVNQRGETAQRGQWTILVKRRPAVG